MLSPEKKLSRGWRGGYFIPDGWGGGGFPTSSYDTNPMLTKYTFNLKGYMISMGPAV